MRLAHQFQSQTFTDGWGHTVSPEPGSHSACFNHDSTMTSYVYNPVYSELVLKPGNEADGGRKGTWHKITLGCMAGLLTLICVAAVGLLVVTQ